MRILICSNIFPPNSGGSGLVARLFAEEFTAQGHEVTVSTSTKGIQADEYAFKLIRNPTRIEVVKAIIDADFVLLLGPLFFESLLVTLSNTSSAMSHQMFLAKGVRGFKERVSSSLMLNICCSQAIAKQLPKNFKTITIPNPYDKSQFTTGEWGHRKDIAFVGRLEKIKGADDCIQAFAKSRIPSSVVLHIFGDGVERKSLYKQVVELGIDTRVKFHGDTHQTEIANFLKSTSVLIVPSRYEPFGIVALEGLAAGCNVIVSNAGGLPEAVGRSGRIYEIGDIDSLAAGIEADYAKDNRADKELKTHLEVHSPSNISSRYLDVIDNERRK